MKEIIFNSDFDSDKLIESFKDCIIEEHRKRLVKKGKLFSICYSEDYLECKSFQLMSGGTGPYWMSPFVWDKLHQKYKDTVSKCLVILDEVCKEFDTELTEINTEGTAKEIIISKKRAN